MNFFIMSDSEDDAVMAEHKREAMHTNGGFGRCERCGKYAQLNLTFLMCKRCMNAVRGPTRQ